MSASSPRHFSILLILLCCIPWISGLEVIPANTLAGAGEGAGEGQQTDDEEEERGGRWSEMDYGSFISTAIGIGAGSTEIVPKGIVIRVPVEGSEEQLTYLFDTDLVRPAAAWVDGFIEFNGIVFDGVHGTYPLVDGEIVWRTAAVAGGSEWAVFDDRRRIPWGPLPSSRARWRGLYRHGDRVILSYDVGGTGILELPGSGRTNGGDLYAIRTLAIEPHSQPIALQVLAAGNSPTRIVTRGDFEETARRDHGTTVCLLESEEGGVFASVAGAANLRWVPVPGGGRGVWVPASEEWLLLEVTYDWGEGEPAGWGDPIRPFPLGVDPRTLISGGPSEWPEEVILEGVLDDQGRAHPEMLSLPDVAGGRTEVGAVDGLSVRLLDSETLLELAGEEAAADTTVIVLERPPAADGTPAWLNDQLLGCWRFDGGQGKKTVNEVAGGAAITLEGAGWRRGIDEGAVEFNGAGRAILEPASALDFDGSDLTMAVWVETRHDGVLIARAPAEGPWPPSGKVFFINGGELVFDVGWVGEIRSSQRVDDGRWHLLGFTWGRETGEVRLYIDGIEVATGELPLIEARPDDIATLGAGAGNFPRPSLFSGKIDNLRLWRRKLSPEEMGALASGEGIPIIEAIALPDAPLGCRIEVTGRSVELVTDRDFSTSSIEVHRFRGSRESLVDFVASLDSTESRPYLLDRITWPEENRWNSWMRFGDFDFFDGGERAVISTWSGDVWIVDGIDADLDHLRWRRFAAGLNQPLGVKVVDGEIYTLGRDQLTHLKDLNGDGEADFYKCFSNQMMNSEHFHEPCVGLQVDDQGRFVFLKAARHALDMLHSHHGTLLRLSRDGSEVEILARGFRAPNGTAIGPDGEFYGTDQEGHWTPANRLNVIVEGGFYGNNWAARLWGMRGDFDPPLCWVHPSIDRSPSMMLAVDSDRWGAIDGGLISLSYGNGKIWRVLREEGRDIPQGGVTPTGVVVPTGVMRARFHPRDGQLYVSGLVGWSSDQPDVGGFYRVRATGAPILGPSSIAVSPSRITFGFDVPLDRDVTTDPGRWQVESWNYRWSAQYGSPDLRQDGTRGRDPHEVVAVELSQDGKVATLLLDRLEPAMQVHVSMKLQTAQGVTFETFVHHTVHETKPVGL